MTLVLPAFISFVPRAILTALIQCDDSKRIPAEWILPSIQTI